MNENIQHNGSKHRKWPWVLLVAFLAVIGLARLALMTAPVHQWVKSTIISSAESTLSPQLSIQNISGDLWNEATLTNIKLTEDTERTVAAIDTLHIEYNLLSYFGDVFQIKKIRLSRPVFKLKQRQDRGWNAEQWINPDITADTTSGSFNFSVADLSISRGRVEVRAMQFGKDSSFAVNDLNISGSLGYEDGSYNADMNNLVFDINDTRLDSTISFQAAAEARESTISLDKLAIATAHSVIKASGKANMQDSSANVKVQATPVGWRDIASYAEDIPIHKDLNLVLGAEGTAEQFEVSFKAESAGIEQFTMKGQFEQDTAALMMTSFRADANRLDLETLLGDTGMPTLHDMEIKLDGQLPVNRYKEVRLNGTVSARNIQQGPYQLDRLEGNIDLNKSDLKLRLEPARKGERILTKLNASQIWSRNPAFSLKVNGSEINPGNWIQDKNYSGQLTFNGEVNGTGWYPDKNFWDYRFTVEKSSLMGQHVDQAVFSGKVNGSSLTNRSQLAIADSRLKLQAEVQQLQTMPLFNYTLTASNVDLSDIKGVEKYPSSISATIKGCGEGSSVSNMMIQAKAKIDSSLLRGEMINHFSAGIGLKDSVVTISEAALKSGIADGDFKGRIHLGDLYNIDNSLYLDFRLKDLSALAPVAGVDVLQAGGSINGRIVPLGQDSTVFKGKVDLQQVNYDSLLVAPNISGGVRVDLNNKPRFVVDVNIDDPTVSSVDMQNIRLNTQGRITETVTDGSFSLEFSGSDEEHIVQSGRYAFKEDGATVTLSQFDLTTALRTLSLQKPFNATFTDGMIKTDTLYLSSPNNMAFMELAIPYADSLHQKGYLRAEKLNLKAMQDAILEKTYLKGMLSGDVQFDRTDTNLTASADVVMSDLLYKETALDTLRLQANVANDRLKGMMELHQTGYLIAEGALDIPFKAQDPGELDEEFFMKPVSGNLALHAVELKRFSTLLQQFGYENTKGTLRFNGSLKGKAGNPELAAEVRLDEARLSEVPIDSFIASADYEHSASQLRLQAGLTSLGQKALDVDAHMPLRVDLRNWDVALPEPQDSISVDIITDGFNLKALNNFLDQKKTRNLAGKVDGKVSIRGPRNDLQTSGNINLGKGAVRIVPAGIRLDHIASTVQFQENKVALTNLRMESGSGYLSAQGELMLEKLVPGEMDFSMKAENFKVANTEEYNGIIDLNMDVAGSVSKPQINGKLSVINGFVELDNFGEKSVEEVSLDTAEAFEPDVSLYDSLSLEMDVEFNRRFFVRNKRYLEMELELDGQIDLLKETDGKLQLFGTLNTANGYAEPLGKRFELEEGSLVFSGPPDNPRINIRTLYEPQQADQELKIWYIIEGNVEDPQFKYESNPPMDFAGILSYTLFGQPFYKLNPTEQSVASSSSSNTAADFAMEVLLDRVESMATRKLGIDVVRIENTRVGGESGTSVTTGWYINPKVFFAIQNVITGSTPTTGFYLEYYLKKNLKLILSQGNDNRQGVDIQWEHDY